MLQEIKVSQKENEVYRRWFEDDYFELIVWYDAGRTEITGFQLCYEKMNNEHALTWRKDKGYAHNAVEDGDEPLKYPSSPVLTQDGAFDAGKVLSKFTESCSLIDESLAGIIIRNLIEYMKAVLPEKEAYGILADTIIKLSYGKLNFTAPKGEGSVPQTLHGSDIKTKPVEQKAIPPGVYPERMPPEGIKEPQKLKHYAPAASEAEKAEKMKEILKKAELFSKKLKKK